MVVHRRQPVSQRAWLAQMAELNRVMTALSCLFLKPPAAGCGGSHTLSVRGHTQAIGHKHAGLEHERESCRWRQSSTVQSEYRESLGLPMLGARFPYWLVLCAHTTSGYAGPCPSAWGLVPPSCLAL